MCGSFSNVNNNVFENHKNSTFKHFLPSEVWVVRHMISNFYISVAVTLIIQVEVTFKTVLRVLLAMLKLSCFGSDS